MAMRDIRHVELHALHAVQHSYMCVHECRLLGMQGARCALTVPYNIREHVTLYDTIRIRDSDNNYRAIYDLQYNTS